MDVPDEKSVSERKLDSLPHEIMDYIYKLIELKDVASLYQSSKVLSKYLGEDKYKILLIYIGLLDKWLLTRSVQRRVVDKLLTKAIDAYFELVVGDHVKNFNVKINHVISAIVNGNTNIFKLVYVGAINYPMNNRTAGDPPSVLNMKELRGIYDSAYILSNSLQRKGILEYLNSRGVIEFVLASYNVAENVEFVVDFLTEYQGKYNEVVINDILRKVVDGDIRLSFSYRIKFLRELIQLGVTDYYLVIQESINCLCDDIFLANVGKLNIEQMSDVLYLIFTMIIKFPTSWHYTSIHYSKYVEVLVKHGANRWDLILFIGVMLLDMNLVNLSLSMLGTSNIETINSAYKTTNWFFRQGQQTTIYFQNKIPEILNVIEKLLDNGANDKNTTLFLAGFFSQGPYIERFFDHALEKEVITLEDIISIGFDEGDIYFIEFALNRGANIDTDNIKSRRIHPDFALELEEFLKARKSDSS